MYRESGKGGGHNDDGQEGSLLLLLGHVGRHEELEEEDEEGDDVDEVDGRDARRRRGAARHEHVDGLRVHARELDELGQRQVLLPPDVARVHGHEVVPAVRAWAAAATNVAGAGKTRVYMIVWMAPLRTMVR